MKTPSIPKKCSIPGFFCLRECTGLTFDQLASESGISRSHLIRLQSGTSSNCSGNLILKLTEAFCCTANDLFSVPSKKRLAEIRVEFLKRELERAMQQYEEAA